LREQREIRKLKREVAKMKIEMQLQGLSLSGSGEKKAKKVKFEEGLYAFFPSLPSSKRLQIGKLGAD
jgi:hypothetical protein